MSPEAGLRREVACQALAKHAVQLAEKSHLLREVSPRALEAANLLRATLFGQFLLLRIARLLTRFLPVYACAALAPNHPFATTLVKWGHRHFFDIAAFASSDESALSSYSLFSLTVYDAITAVAQERPLEMFVH